MIDCSSESEHLIIQMYARMSTGYSAFVHDPAVDPTICLSPDRACQCVGHRQISVIPPPVSCLCTTFEAVNVDPKAVIDARGAAVTLLLVFFFLFFFLRQNFTCQLPSEDVPLRLTVVCLPEVVQCDLLLPLSQSITLIVESCSGFY